MLDSTYSQIVSYQNKSYNLVADLLAHEPGVDGRPDIVGVHGPGLPVHADHVTVLHQQEGQPHLARPDLLAAGPKPMDDDLARQGDIEVAGGDGAGV